MADASSNYVPTGTFAEDTATTYVPQSLDTASLVPTADFGDDSVRTFFPPVSEASTDTPLAAFGSSTALGNASDTRLPAEVLDLDDLPPFVTVVAESNASGSSIGVYWPRLVQDLPALTTPGNYVLTPPPGKPAVTVSSVVRDSNTTLTLNLGTRMVSGMTYTLTIAAQTATDQYGIKNTQLITTVLVPASGGGSSGFNGGLN